LPAAEKGKDTGRVLATIPEIRLRVIGEKKKENSRPLTSPGPTEGIPIRRPQLEKWKSSSSGLARENEKKDREETSACANASDKQRGLPLYSQRLLKKRRKNLKGKTGLGLSESVKGGKPDIPHQAYDRGGSTERREVRRLVLKVTASTKDPSRGNGE